MFLRDIANRLNEVNILVTGEIEDFEFRQLRGYLRNLCIFAIDTIDTPVKVTKTGARHNHAKWLLLPVRIRRRFRIDEYDFSDVKCSCVEYEDKVFFIYMLRKGRKG